MKTVIFTLELIYSSTWFLVVLVPRTSIAIGKRAWHDIYHGHRTNVHDTAWLKSCQSCQWKCTPCLVWCGPSLGQNWQANSFIVETAGPTTVTNVHTAEKYLSKHYHTNERNLILALMFVHKHVHAFPIAVNPCTVLTKNIFQSIFLKFLPQITLSIPHLLTKFKFIIPVSQIMYWELFLGGLNIFKTTVAYCTQLGCAYSLGRGPRCNTFLTTGCSNSIPCF